MLFASEHPLVRHKVALLRNVDTEPKKFRELVRELSMLLCYEATQDLELVEEDVQTPMGIARGQRLRSAARDMHGKGKAAAGSMARDARSSSLHRSG